jgi:choline kinase
MEINVLFTNKRIEKGAFCRTLYFAVEDGDFMCKDFINCVCDMVFSTACVANIIEDSTKLEVKQKEKKQ